jgi:hypothetical protein
MNNSDELTEELRFSSITSQIDELIKKHFGKIETTYKDRNIIKLKVKKNFFSKEEKKYIFVKVDNNLQELLEEMKEELE